MRITPNQLRNPYTKPSRSFLSPRRPVRRTGIPNTITPIISCGAVMVTKVASPHDYRIVMCRQTLDVRRADMPTIGLNKSELTFKRAVPF